MIIDDLPSISIANDSDEIAIEQGTATKKINKGNFLQEITSAISTINTTLSSKATKAELGTYVRPNLLDNWYFGIGVINQRGQSSYSATGYFLDRWKNTSSNNSQMQISSSGLKVTNSSVSGAGTISQFLENDLGGYEVTASLLFSDGTLLTGTGVFPNAGGSSVTVISRTGNKAGCVLENNSGSHPAFTITSNPSSTFTLVAVKLELGDAQTLAHQVSNSWVLNAIPNPAEEFAKCLTYFYRFAVSVAADVGVAIAGSNNSALLSWVLPQVMVSIPTVTASIGSALILTTGGAGEGVDSTAIARGGSSPARVTLSISASLTKSTVYRCIMKANSILDFSAEL